MPKKRSAQGAGSIRKRKDGSWEARYTTGRDPGTGKQVRKSVYGKTQKEVLEKLKRVQADIQNGVYVEPSKLTLSQWLDLWTDEYCAHLKVTTRDMYKRVIDHNVKPAIGAVKLSEITPAVVQSFCNSLQRQENPLSNKTIKNIHGILSGALRQAVEAEYLRSNPAARSKLPKVEKPEIKPLQRPETALFLQAIKGHRYERAFIVDLFTGLRQAELIGLTWDCVNIKAGTIHVTRQLQLVDGEYLTMPPKNGKARTINPAQFVMDTLKEQKRSQAEWRLLAGPAWNSGNYVFTNELGEHLKRHTLYKNFKAIMAGIGLPDVRFHDLRHSYAVNALLAGDDIKTVQENLGHHTAAFTLDTYAHVTDEMRKASAARMDSFITELQNSEC